jgi:tRNA-specific 2-thiouridylase
MIANSIQWKARGRWMRLDADFGLAHHSRRMASAASGPEKKPVGRVLVAMSGGVDSSVAAALLAEQGYDLVGVTLHLWDAEGEHKVGRCCAPEDRDDARLTCEHLGIPHYVMDERSAFRARVVDPFIVDNRAGRTPSPCVQCNQHVKLTRLMQLADSFGATHIATGHYARIVPDTRGHSQLLEGLDAAKDQSYFLFGVPQSVLSRLILPLGDLVKDQSREHARRLGLPNWDKPDSQELCFVPDGNVAGFVAREQGAEREGFIVDEAGNRLGTHTGVSGFTVGQRRGLGIATGVPRYVLRIVHETNDVVVGADEGLFGSEFAADSVTWTAGHPTGSFEGQVRVRYRHRAAGAQITPTDAGFHVRFHEPQRALAPGQAAVVYDGARVVGGGTITG